MPRMSCFRRAPELIAGNVIKRSNRLSRYCFPAIIGIRVCDRGDRGGDFHGRNNDVGMKSRGEEARINIEGIGKKKTGRERGEITVF